MIDKPSEHEIGIIDIIQILLNHKYLIVITSTIFFIFSLFYAMNASDIYKSETVLSPNFNEKNTTSLNALGPLNPFSGIISSTPSATKTSIGLEVLKSRKFFFNLLANNEILIPLMASKGWDSVNKKLILNESIFSSQKNTWNFNTNSEDGSPTNLQAYEKFTEDFEVEKNLESGLITLSYEHQSPVFAKKMLDLLVEEVNEVTRNEDVAQAEKSIDYLYVQINNTQLVELRVQLFELIQKEIETIMLSKSNSEYLFKIIDPPIISEQPIKPNRLLIILLGTFLGFFMGIFAVLVNHILKSNNFNEKNYQQR